MGGHQVPEHGPGDDGYDPHGYDETQRAELLEVTRGGPTDGITQTDVDPDLGDTDEDNDEQEDDLLMTSEELGDDEVVDQDARDREEDELQEDFDNDRLEPGALEAELDDDDAAALEP